MHKQTTLCGSVNSSQHPLQACLPHFKKCSMQRHIHVVLHPCSSLSTHAATHSDMLPLCQHDCAYSCHHSVKKRNSGGQA